MCVDKNTSVLIKQRPQMTPVSASLYLIFILSRFGLAPGDVFDEIITTILITAIRPSVVSQLEGNVPHVVRHSPGGSTWHSDRFKMVVVKTIWNNLTETSSRSRSARVVGDGLALDAVCCWTAHPRRRRSQLVQFSPAEQSMKEWYNATTSLLQTN